jgi:AraC-like DNA-binding protein
MTAMHNVSLIGKADADFARVMIPHHQGAIEMAKLELEFGADPNLRRLAQEQMAAVVYLSPFHFARQFKAATRVRADQYVMVRRVERAQHLLRTEGGLGLAEVAFRSGFANQSHFCFQFKRIVGITPRQFQTSARIP